MALSDVFLSPLGLLALLAVVPVVVLYLIRPDPETVDLPTLRFLVERQRQETTNPLLEQLRRNLLLLLQLLVLVALALALASPYVLVPERVTVEETVLVVDASASMATQSGGGTRFDRAVAAAGEEATSTTSVVVATGDGRVELRDGSPQEVRRTLEELRVTDSPGDLRSAIAQAAAIAGENAQIVVLSDFAGDTDWEDEVQAARAREIRVTLRQFADGGDDNVGIIDRSFAGQNVTLAVKNFGERPVDRTVTLAGARRRVSLRPGDVAFVTLPVPAGGGVARLAPTDSFSTDDVAYVAAPSDAAIDVLLLTNDGDRYLRAALSVIDEVSLTVEEPPTSITRQYDVIVYGDVTPGRLLDGNVEAGRRTVERGGGVAVTAQTDMPTNYGTLLPVETTAVGTTPTIRRVAPDELTRDIRFPPPEEYLVAGPGESRVLVETADGSPLLAVAERPPGRILYYGFIEESSAFKFNYQYPVFWKRAVFYLAGRDPLPLLNRESGGVLQYQEPQTVQTPDGTVTGTAVVLDRTGFYATGSRQVGVSLYSERESDVAATPLAERERQGGVSVREERQQAPFAFTGPLALAALAVALLELAYLRRRGDL